MYRFLALFRDALRALRRNVLRTLLTMLGVIIGVAAVIAMVAIGGGASDQVKLQVDSLGENLVIVMAGGAQVGAGVLGGAGTAGTLTVADAEAIRREVPGVRHVSPEARSAAQVAAGNENCSTQVLGVGVEYPALRNWPLAGGEFFGAAAERAAARVAVLGRTVARALFGDGDPIGAVVRIDGVPFTVIGVLAAKGANMMGQDQDDAVLVPYTAALRRLLGQTNLRMINVGAESAAAMGPVQREIAALLRQRHRLPAGREDDFTIRTQEELAAFAGSTTRIMAGLLGAIAGVSLLVGGIGIMNIMLVSVTERTREIGLRLALGARRRDILRQFLIEAALLSAAGGVVGVAAGLGISRVAAWVLNWPAAAPVSVVAGAVVFSAGVGVFFGFYPARRAARMDPIEALRRE